MILYSFHADWWGPCQMMKPIINQIEEERPDINVIRINADEAMAMCQEFEIIGVPTFIAIKDDGTRTRISGATTKKDFIEKLGL